MVESQTTTIDPVIMTSPASSLTIRDSLSASKSRKEKPLTPILKSTKSMINAKNIITPAQPRPFSAPSVPKHKPPAVVLSPPRRQTTPVLSCSMSEIGRIGVDPAQSTVNPVQSYRNAIMGRTASISASKSTSASSSTEQIPPKSELTFGTVALEKLQSSALTRGSDDSLPSTRLHHLGENSVSSSSQQLLSQALTQDEFPHIDIINDLLNEESSTRERGVNGYIPQSYSALNEHLYFRGGVSSAATSASTMDDTYLFSMGSQLYEQLLVRESGSFGQRAQHSQPFDLSSVCYIDGSVQKEWPGGPTRSHSLGSNYYDPDYVDMVRVMNGFNSEYHPSNGH